MNTPMLSRSFPAASRWLPALFLLLACTRAWAGAAPATPSRASEAPAAASAPSFSVPVGEIEVKVQRGKDPAHVLPIGRVPALKDGDTILIKPTFAAPKEDLKWVMAWAPIPATAFDKPEVKCVLISDKDAWKKFNALPVPAGRRLVILFLPYEPRWNLGSDAVRRAAEKDMREHWGPFRDLAIALASAQQGPATIQAALNSLKSATRSEVPESNADRLRQAAKLLGLPDPPKTGDVMAWKSWAVDASGKLRGQGAAKPSILSTASGMLLPGVSTIYASAAVAVGSLVRGLVTAKVSYDYMPSIGIPGDPGAGEFTIGLWADRMPQVTKDSRTALIYSPANDSSGLTFALDTAESICVGMESATVPIKPAVMQAAVCYGGTDWQMEVVGGPKALPASLDPAAGGFVIDVAAIRAAVGDQKMLQGVIRGKWGFDDVASHPFPFFLANHRNWSIDAAGRGRLIAGTPQVTLVARSDGPVRVVKAAAKGEGPNPCRWECVPNGPDAATLTLDLSGTAAGETWVRIGQDGVESPDTLKLTIYEPLPKLADVEIHAGDRAAMLTGDRLQLVKEAKVGNVLMSTPILETNPPRLSLQCAQPLPEDWGDRTMPLQVALKDGRLLEQPANVQVRPARPRVEVAQVTLPELQGIPTTTGTTPVAPPGTSVSIIFHTTFPYECTPEATLELLPDEVPPSPQPPLQVSAANGLTILNETLKATLKTTDLLRGRPWGRILARVRDGRAGTGDWMPLLLVVPLPSIERVVLAPAEKCRLVGTGLERIVGVAAEEAGPFAPPEAESAAGGAAHWRQFAVKPDGDKPLFLRVQDCPETLRLSAERQAPQAWSVTDDDRQRLLKADGVSILLRAPDPRWVARVWLEDGAKAQHAAQKTVAEAGGLRATFNLANAAPGPAAIKVERDALERPESIDGLTLYEPMPRVTAISLRAGEKEGTLDGERLGLLRAMTLEGHAFSPAGAAGDGAHLPVSGTDAALAEWDGKTLALQATLADGRTLQGTVRADVAPARPAVTLQEIRSAEPPNLPLVFDREKELSDRASVTLQLAPAGGYVLRTPLLEVRGVPPAGAGQIGKIPCRVGPASTMAGPFTLAGLWGRTEFRVVDGEAGESAWMPLPRQIVRVPALEKVVRSAENAFTLSGNDLDLITGVAVKAGDAPAGLTEGVRPAGKIQALGLPTLAYAVSNDRKQITLFLALLDNKSPVEATIPFEEPAPPTPPPTPAAPAQPAPAQPAPAQPAQPAPAQPTPPAPEQPAPAQPTQPAQPAPAQPTPPAQPAPAQPVQPTQPAPAQPVQPAQPGA